MQKIIGVTDLQRQFRTVFDDVVFEHTPYVLTRGSRPEAALIPYDEYLQFLQLREADVLQRMDEVRTRLTHLETRRADLAERLSRAIHERDLTVARIEAQAAADVANAYTVGANDAERGAIVPATQ